MWIWEYVNMWICEYGNTLTVVMYDAWCMIYAVWVINVPYQHNPSLTFLYSFKSIFYILYVWYMNLNIWQFVNHISHVHNHMRLDCRLTDNTGHWDLALCCVNLETGHIVQTAKQHSDVISCVCVCEDFGRYWLVTGSRDCTLQVSNVHYMLYYMLCYMLWWWLAVRAVFLFEF